jgi:hypothetical protein
MCLQVTGLPKKNHTTLKKRIHNPLPVPMTFNFYNGVFYQNGALEANKVQFKALYNAFIPIHHGHKKC